MLARLLAALSVTALAVLFKRLVLRKPPALPYRTPQSEWPSSYRKPFEERALKKGTGYFSTIFAGRPRVRIVDSRPSSVAIAACQSSAPNGRCRFTETRSLVSS